MSKRLVYQDRGWNIRVGLIASVFSAAGTALVASVGYAFLPPSTPAAVAYSIAVAGAAIVAGAMTVRRHLTSGVWLDGSTLVVRGPLRLVKIETDDIVSVEPRQVFVDNYCVRLRLRPGAASKAHIILALPFDHREVLRDITPRAGG